MSREPIRDLMARGSLGCPNTPQCGHLLSEHTVDDWDGNGDPVNPRCPGRPDVKRINVAVAADTVQAIEQVIQREQITLTAAVHRLVAYGAFVYQTIRVDQRTITTHADDGTDTRHVVLLDAEVDDA